MNQLQKTNNISFNEFNYYFLISTSFETFWEYIKKNEVLKKQNSLYIIENKHFIHLQNLIKHNFWYTQLNKQKFNILDVFFNLLLLNNEDVITIKDGKFIIISKNQNLDPLKNFERFNHLIEETVSFKAMYEEYKEIYIKKRRNFNDMLSQLHLIINKYLKDIEFRNRFMIIYSFNFIETLIIEYVTSVKSNNILTLEDENLYKICKNLDGLEEQIYDKKINVQTLLEEAEIIGQSKKDYRLYIENIKIDMQHNQRNLTSNSSKYNTLKDEYYNLLIKENKLWFFKKKISKLKLQKDKEINVINGIISFLEKNKQNFLKELESLQKKENELNQSLIVINTNVTNLKKQMAQENQKLHHNSKLLCIKLNKLFDKG